MGRPVRRLAGIGDRGRLSVFGRYDVVRRQSKFDTIGINLSYLSLVFIVAAGNFSTLYRLPIKTVLDQKTLEENPLGVAYSVAAAFALVTVGMLVCKRVAFLSEGAEGISNGSGTDSFSPLGGFEDLPETRAALAKAGKGIPIETQPKKQISIEPQNGGWVARCRCGWVSTEKTDESTAVKAGNRHSACLSPKES